MPGGDTSWLSWAIFAAALFAAGVNGWYLVEYPKGNKFWLRFLNAVLICYFGFLYLFMGMNLFNLAQPPPILVRPGIVLLLLLLASEALFDVLRKR